MCIVELSEATPLMSEYLLTYLVNLCVLNCFSAIAVINMPRGAYYSLPPKQRKHEELRRSQDIYRMIIRVTAA